MFNPGEQLIKRIKFGALCVGVVAVLCLLGVLRYQYNTIIDLRADNKEQAQTIKAQQEVNKVLNVALQQERAAVIEQQQENAKIEDEANAKAETIRTIIKTQPCARTRLPEPIEWMRK
jgi:putative lytic protein Rz